MTRDNPLLRCVFCGAMWHRDMPAAACTARRKESGRLTGLPCRSQEEISTALATEPASEYGGKR